MNNTEVIKVFVTLLSFTILVGLLLGMFFELPYGNIAVIKINGDISSDSVMDLLSAGGVSSEEIAKTINDIKNNPLIEAVIIDINSGGGSSVASHEIVRALKELDKPKIALIREVGASGAYWIASACDHIIAHDLSLVGSIGVNMEYLEYSGLLKIFNVSYVNLSYPEHKSIFSQYRPLSEEERNTTQKWLEKAYDYFLTDVAINRNMTKEEMKPYANGSVFMGYEALEYGLIDELGGMNEAMNKTIELTNITEPIIIQYPQETSMIDLLKGINGQSNNKIRI